MPNSTIKRVHELRDELVREYHHHMEEASKSLANAKEIEKTLWSTFRVKVKIQKPKRASTAAKKAEPPAPGNSKKIASLNKRLERARMNLSQAADLKKTKVLQDLVFELEDEIRLLTTQD